MQNSEIKRDEIYLYWIIVIVVIILYFGALFLAKFLNLNFLDMSLFQFLIDINPFFTVIASLVLVGVTIRYVIETKNIAQSNRDYVRETKDIAESNRQNVNTTKEIVEYNKKNLQHQVILVIQENYRQEDMVVAIRGLWDFRDEIEKTVKERENYDKRINRYKVQKNKCIFELKIFNEVQDEMLKEYESRMVEYLDRELDNKRRLISYFFQHLYDMIYNDPDLEVYLKKFFLEPSMKQTIKYILIPMEKKLIEMINNKKRVGIKPLKKDSDAIKKLQSISDLIID